MSVNSNYKLKHEGNGMLTSLNAKFAMAIEYFNSPTPAEKKARKALWLLQELYETQSLNKGSLTLACAIIGKNVPLFKKLILILLKLKGRT